MATFTKAHLSGAADGLAVKVAATSSTGTTVHTAVSGTTAGSFSECWIWAVNTSAAAVKLTIEWGTTTAADADGGLSGRGSRTKCRRLDCGDKSPSRVTRNSPQFCLKNLKNKIKINSIIWLKRQLLLGF